ncbi:chaperone protein dnaJ 1, mitochondrial-like isoform X1 [Papaver somniferum]|uniref:chaperone protein dnaJ 1, mitochondrial-like isoform X1 n=1 Tax=Papaver somniferum TaxID=3469 RepID=UPI000E6F4B8E|nr:chaperone protein dnaJ 1, mitochondrial-like isoform X1 [Papaver somniferum]
MSRFRLIGSISNIRKLHRHKTALSLVADEFLHQENGGLRGNFQSLHSLCRGVSGVDVRLLNIGGFLNKRYFHATGSCQRDFYEVLGVPKDANRDDIKKAFQGLAKKYHPDANKNNPAAKRKFQEISEAYQTLKDAEKRAQYDMENTSSAGKGNYYGRNPQGYSTRTAGDFSGFHEEHFSSSFRNIFSEIFEEVDDFAPEIQVELNLSFAEAAQGCQKKLKFNARVPCGSCNGLGHPAYAKMKVCPTCGGIGRVTIPPFTSTCSACKGQGRVVKEICTACRGGGVVEGVKEVTVIIPAGVETGDTISVKNAGNSAGRGVLPGTLYIKLNVAKDSIFRRDGADIHVDANISFTQAIIGGKVHVPALSGEMQIKIPKGVQPGHTVVLRSKGLPTHGGYIQDFGDQYVHFRVKFPTSLNERQRALMEEFAKEECMHGNSAPEPEGENWLKPVVDIVTGPNFVRNFSIFLLILLLLSKATS